MNMVAIGITGFSGAGKDSVAEYLAERYDFKPFSVRDFLKDVIQKRGLPVNRDSMIETANELRNRYGAEYIVSQLYQKALEEGINCTISSIRTVGEAKELKQKKNFVLIAVMAPLETRFERIHKRGNESDKVSFDEFKKQEKKENTSTRDTEQNVLECIKMADYFVDNSREDKSFLYQELDLVVNRILEHDTEYKAEISSNLERHT
jgi:dephospho-CoA kinase